MLEAARDGSWSALQVPPLYHKQAEELDGWRAAVGTDISVERHLRADADGRVTYRKREAAHRLGVSTFTIDRLVAAGLVRTAAVGGHRLILASSLEDMLRHAMQRTGRIKDTPRQKKRKPKDSAGLPNVT